MFYLTGCLRTWNSVSNEGLNYYYKFRGWGKEFITPLSSCNFISTNNDIAVVEFNESCRISVDMGLDTVCRVTLKAIDINSLKLIKSSSDDLVRGIGSQYLIGGLDRVISLEMPLIKEEGCSFD